MVSVGVGGTVPKEHVAHGEDEDGLADWPACPIGPWMETGGCSSIILSPAGGWGGGGSTPAGVPDGS